MPGPVNVSSIDALRQFRAVLVKFAADVRGALDAADADIRRTQHWLDGEAEAYWQGRITKLTQRVAQARDALRHKKLYPQASGAAQDTADEERELKIAQRQLEEAEQKIVHVKRWSRNLEREAMMYRGQVQSLLGAVDIDVPNAVARLDRMAAALERYLAREGEGVAASIAEAVSMARADEAAYADIGSDPRALRNRTPGVILRDATEPGEAGQTAAALGANAGKALTPNARDALGRLPLGEAAASDAKVLVVPGALGQARVYLERVPTDAEGDSGWHIGPADFAVASDEYVAVRVAEVLGLRPDLREVLRLGPGWLVVLNDGGVEAALDEANVDVWAATQAGNQSQRT
jgi:hypothetical protein